MRRSMLGLTLAVGVVIGAVPGAVVTSRPSGAAQAAPGRCSTSGLDGAYAVTFNGHSATLGRFASVSLWRFDGRGRFTASETHSSEQDGPGRRRVSGRYSVTRDCRFVIGFSSALVKPHNAAGACILMDRGRQFTCLDNEEGWVATSIGTKI